MAILKVNDDGSIGVSNTQKKKKKKQADLIVGSDGKITFNDEPIRTRLAEKEEEEDIAPVRTDSKKGIFNSGLFDDGYHFGDVTKTLIGTTKNITEDGYKSLAGLGEDILIDAPATLVGGAAKLLGKDGFADKTSKFVARNLVEEYGVADKLANKVSPLNSVLNLANNTLNKGNHEEVSLLGEKADEFVQMATHTAGIAGLQRVGVPWQVTSGLSAFGSSAEEAFQNDATYGEAVTYGGINAGLEIIFNKLAGGLKFEGKGIIDGAKATVLNRISNRTVKTLAQYGIDMAGEGTEELLTEIGSNIAKKLTYADESTWKELLVSDEALDNYLTAFVAGGLISGSFNAKRVHDSVKSGRDYETGLTDNEQSVVNAEITNRTTEIQKQRAVKQQIDRIIEERERTFGNLSDSEKKSITQQVQTRLEAGEIDFTKTELSKKEIAKIESEVMEDLRNGYIGIDIIENTLSGEKTARLRELEQSLTNITNEAKKAEIEAEINQIRGDRANELKSLLSKDVILQESYRQEALKKEEFTYEVAETDSDITKELVESAKASKMNNTRKMHNLFEYTNKIANDSGTKYGFVNNEQLKELGYDVEERTVNGLVRVDKDGSAKVLINVDSDKAINTIIGHETTHLLEGTNEYKALQDIVKEYAIAKGDYDGRFKQISKLYEGKNANVENEVTADLVGDYLFTDEQFINNLSAKQPNVFQRVYDYIKHVYKMATAGSKEARQLEQVKRRFDKAYKEMSKTTTGKVDSNLATEADSDTSKNNDVVKFSLSDNDSSIKEQLRKNLEVISKMQPVADTTYEDISHLNRTQKAESIIAEYDKKFKGGIERQNFGFIELDKKLVTGSLKYLYTDGEFAAFKALPQVLKRGEIISGHADHKGRAFDTVTIAAPVVINGTIGYVGAVVKVGGKNKYHVHRILMPDGSEFGFKDNKKTEPTGVGVPIDNDSQRSTISSATNSISAEGTKNNTKFSLSDSQGRELTKDQQEYFKDTVVKDKKGRIKAVYHGTNRQFNIFKPGDIGMHFGTKTAARDRVGRGKKTRLVEAYVNITNPIVFDEDLGSWDADYRLAQELLNRGIISYEEGIKALRTDSGYKRSTEDSNKKLRELLQSKGYDGIVYKNSFEGTGGNSYIAFSSNQIKLVTNEDPTDNPDINLSLSAPGENKIPVKGYAVYGSDIKLKNDIAPVKETISKMETVAKNATVEDIAPVKDVEHEEEPETPGRTLRREIHRGYMDTIRDAFDKHGYNLDDVLSKAKSKSTFSSVDNTPQRFIEKTLGYKEGQILNDLTTNKTALNESKGIKWLNSFTDRKNGLLAQIAKEYNIKPNSKEDAAAQMYGEGFYLNDAGDFIKYGDMELALDFPDAIIRNNIKKLATDPRIRRIYDETLEAINESRKRNGYPEIPRRDNYFLHFRAMDDTFSKIGLPFNPNDIRAKDLPTDINGMTAALKPGQPYFASAQKRMGLRTSHSLIGGMERYLGGAKNQIYHIDDIQILRALRNYVADMYGQANGLEGLDTMTEEEAEERIKQVYDAHLSNFAKFLNEQANVLAGKTSLADRGLEGIIGRRGITTLNTINSQVGKNMVGFNPSSSLTNLVSAVQAFAKTNKYDSMKALSQTIYNRINSINGKTDGFVENDPTMIRRKGAQKLTRTPFEVISDAGYSLMSGVDSISSEFIIRAKYNELTRKGMGDEQAHIEAGKWASRILGDRSLGQQPHLYNSKMLGLFTKFQLEVRNQLDSQFYDTIQEANISTEQIKDQRQRNAVRAAKITSTFVQLAVFQHLFGKAFEAVAGYNPTFDIINVLIKTLGFDDDEESEDTVLDNIEEGFLELIEDLPYTSTFTGGRIPIQSALPIEELVTGKDEYGNKKSRFKTAAEIAPYYVMPGGYNQIKKTAQGLSMFDDDNLVTGSYTDSGNLRFPVDKTPLNVIQAGVFGQWANENARDYIENERKPLGEKQIQEYKDLKIPIADYWKYREGLKEKKTLEEKFDYVAGLNFPVAKKNIMINNIVSRKEAVDMTDYDQFASYEEFDWAIKNPEKYSYLESIGVSYKQYKASEESKNAYNWVYEHPEKFSIAKAAAGDVVTYRNYVSGLNDIKADKTSSGKTISGSRKTKVANYINSLDADYGSKLILFKTEYPSDNTYNYEIVEYLNNRKDISHKEMVEILKELGFVVDSNGNVRW